MGLLQQLETKLAKALESPFGRIFRSEVRPIELARRLAREMDARKTVSLSTTYVPNAYTVYLSTQDYKRVSDYRDDLVAELEAYLLEYSRREGVQLSERPVVTLSLDDRLRLGEFGVAARTLSKGPSRATASKQTQRAGTKPSEQRRSNTTASHRVAYLSLDGERTELSQPKLLIGRSHDCDLVIDSPNVSRQHAEVRRTEDGWALLDLRSTNGVVVNGRRVRGTTPLRDGDLVLLGDSELHFQSE